MRKGKGRPDITEVMFFSGYPSGSNSSLDSCNMLKKISARKGGGEDGGGVGGVMAYT
jgi:hypothetical protein